MVPILVDNRLRCPLDLTEQRAAKISRIQPVNPCPRSDDNRAVAACRSPKEEITMELIKHLNSRRPPEGD